MHCRTEADEVLVWPAADDGQFTAFSTALSCVRRCAKARNTVAPRWCTQRKLSALGTLVAGVAHEINNPLMALQLSIEACMALMTPLANVVHELSLWATRGWGATPEQVQMLHDLAMTGAPRVEGRQLLEEMLAASSAIAAWSAI